MKYILLEEAAPDSREEEKNGVSYAVIEFKHLQ